MSADFRFSLACEACNKTYKRREQYDEHVAQHVKCAYCAYSASRKLVLQHQDQVHGPNGRKLPPLDTPEDIQKWIEERKKRWPTAANVARKVCRELTGGRAVRAALTTVAMVCDAVDVWQEEERAQKRAAKRSRPIEDDLAAAAKAARMDGASDKDSDGEADGASSGGSASESEEAASDSDAASSEGEAGQHGSRGRGRGRGARLCRYFARGHCRMGARCAFSHDRGAGPSPSRERGGRPPAGAARLSVLDKVRNRPSREPLRRVCC